MNRSVIAVCLMLLSGQALSEMPAGFCADEAQTATVREYYAENPGAQPAIVALRTGLTEAIVLSALDSDKAVSASGELFPDIWSMMEQWEQATFLIMKGANVFEALSPIGKGTQSTRSQYFNIAYKEPFRGHLRPDQYVAIYGVAIPQPEDIVNRGLIFLDADGNSVFAAFISGDSMPTTPAEIAKFEAVIELLGQNPGVCP